MKSDDAVSENLGFVLVLGLVYHKLYSQKEQSVRNWGFSIYPLSTHWDSL